MSKRRPSTVGSADTLPIAGLGARVEVRRHPAARRMTLRVSRTNRAVIVTLPVQCDLDAAGRFVGKHADWVRQRLHDLPEPVPFVDGALVPLRGEPHRVRITGERGRGPVVARLERPGEAPLLDVSGRTEHGARRLRDWLAIQAMRDLEGRVDHHCAVLGLTAARIAVRDQSSRWGSCSTTGVLSFSWRLVMAPPLVLDYVAAHEVAHLAEMNHGPRFWALVKRTFPRLAEAKQWLKSFGADLHRYG